jgi:hypothetical protein
MSFDSSTTSVTYKGVEKRRPPACSDLRCFNTLRKNWLLTYNISPLGETTEKPPLGETREREQALKITFSTAC